MSLSPQEILRHDVEELMRLSHLLQNQPEKEEVKKQIRYLSNKMGKVCKKMEEPLDKRGKQLLQELEEFLLEPTLSYYEKIKELSLELHNNLTEL